MIRRRASAPDTAPRPPAPAVRPEHRASIVRFLASAIAADLRDFPRLTEPSGTPPSGSARREPRAVVGQLHPPLAALASSA